MSGAPLDSAALEAMNAAALRMPLLASVAFRLASQSREGVEATLEVTESASFGTGHLNGVELYGLLDTTAWFAIAPHLGPEEAAVTHDAHFSILGTAKRGETVTITAHVEKRGRTTAFLRAEARVAGRTFALATVTKTVIPLAQRLRHAGG